MMNFGSNRENYLYDSAGWSQSQSWTSQSQNQSLTPRSQSEIHGWTPLSQSQAQDLTPISQSQNFELTPLSQSQVQELTPWSQNLELTHLSQGQAQKFSTWSQGQELTTSSENQIQEWTPLSQGQAQELLYWSQGQAQELTPWGEISQVQELAPWDDISQAQELTPWDEISHAQELAPWDEISQAQELAPCVQIQTQELTTWSQGQDQGLAPCGEIQTQELTTWSQGQAQELSNPVQLPSQLAETLYTSDISSSPSQFNHNFFLDPVYSFQSEQTQPHECSSESTSMVTDDCQNLLNIPPPVTLAPVNQNQTEKHTYTADVVIEKIEEQIAAMADAFSQGRYPVLTKTTLKGGIKSESMIHFGRELSRMQFTVLTVIMGRAHTLLLTGKTLTNRDLYYENVKLFGNQPIVNKAIESVGAILQVPIESLPFEPSAKGLMAGGDNLWLKRYVNNNHTDTVVVNKKGSLVPCASTLRDWGKFTSNAKFILIVEKDAIFQRLIDQDIWTVFDPFILITGKGFPDRATKAFASKLTVDLKIPSFVLVDGDAYGILIAVNYKHGSTKSILHVDSNFTLPELTVIGVLPSEFEMLAMKEDCKLSFGERDSEILNSLIKRLTALDDQQLLAEVQKLQDLQFKVEIEAVAQLGARFLVTYIRSKINPHLHVLNLNIVN